MLAAITKPLTAYQGRQSGPPLNAIYQPPSVAVQSVAVNVKTGQEHEYVTEFTMFKQCVTYSASPAA